jgi:hypothetical protein
MPLEPPTTDSPNAEYRATFADLCRQLPPLPDEDPDSLAVRQRRAMDAVVALTPHDAFEILLAVRIVAMNAHAADALRATAAAPDALEARRCRAQATSMARQSDAALRTLLRMQETRRKLEAAMHPEAMEQAGYWFKSVGVPAAPEPPPAATPPPGDAEPVRTEAQIDADAALYEVLYPDRVARILAAGGLPPRLDFGPPEPEIVAALLRRAGPVPGAPSRSAGL